MKKILVGVTTLIITGLSYGQPKPVSPSPFIKITTIGYGYTSIHDERKEDGTYGDPKPKEQTSNAFTINTNNILTISEIKGGKVDMWSHNIHYHIYYTYICKTRIRMINGDEYYINEDINIFLKRIKQ